MNKADAERRRSVRAALGITGSTMKPSGVQAVATAPENRDSVLSGPVVADKDEPDMRGVKLIIDPPSSQLSASERAVPPAPASAQRSLVAAQPNTGKATVAATERQAENAVSDPYAELPYLRQLPVSTQREIPELRFSVHIYSDSRSGRMVKLNDRMMREGQRVAPGLNIETIIPRAVVFNYGGQRFKMPAR